MADNKPFDTTFIVKICVILILIQVIINMPLLILFISGSINIHYWSFDLNMLSEYITYCHWTLKLLGMFYFLKSMKTISIINNKVGFVFLIVHFVLLAYSFKFFVEFFEMDHEDFGAFIVFIYVTIPIIWDIITLPLVIIIAFKIRKYILLKQVKPENT